MLPGPGISGRAKRVGDVPLSQFSLHRVQEVEV